MNIYKWDVKYNVDFEPIDNQHKILLEIINKLLINQLKEKKIIVMLLNELALYAKFHFLSEETFMKIYSYEGYEDHKVEHDELLNQVIRKNNEYVEGKIKLENIVVFLVEWFTSHTAKIDKDLGKFLKGAVVLTKGNL
jgi:hemerythrin